MANVLTSAKLPLTGGVGTVGYKLMHTDGTQAAARTTVGITELVTSSGLYQANPAAPANFTSGTAVWDDGSGNYAIENVLAVDISAIEDIYAPRTIYVSGNGGNDANPGTRDEPVATVSAAASLVKNGDAIVGTATSGAIASGNGSFVTGKRYATISDLVIDAEPLENSAAIDVLRNAKASRLSIDSAENGVSLAQGAQITNSVAYATKIGVEATSASADLGSVIECEIGANAIGVKASGFGHFTLEKSYVDGGYDDVTDFDGHAVLLSTVANVLIENCLLSNYGASAGDNSVVKVTGHASLPSIVIIRGNVLYSEGGNSASPISGLIADGTGAKALTVIIENCTINVANAGAGGAFGLRAINGAKILYRNVVSNAAHSEASGGTVEEMQPDDLPTNAELTAALVSMVETYHLDHLFGTSYDPSNKPGAGDALLNELIENDGGVARFTANALELGPTGTATIDAEEVAEALSDLILGSLTVSPQYVDDDRTWWFRTPNDLVAANILRELITSDPEKPIVFRMNFIEALSTGTTIASVDSVTIIPSGPILGNATKVPDQVQINIPIYSALTGTSQIEPGDYLVVAQVTQTDGQQIARQGVVTFIGSGT